MSDSSFPVDQTDTFKLRQSEERRQAFQEQSEMYHTMKTSLCDCSNCINAREESARRQLPDIPKPDISKPDISQWNIPVIHPLSRPPSPSDEAIDIAYIYSSN